MIGIAIATPLAVAAAIWIVEYGRPAWLARAVESGIEIIAGTPDIVIAIFGLALFQQGSSRRCPSPPQGGAVFGRSFLTAGAMMSLIALPMVFGGDARGAAVDPRATCARRPTALGKTRIATIRRVLLPSVSRTSPPAPRSAWGGSPATPRSSSSCSARRCASTREGSFPGVGAAARHRRHADELRLQQLARGRGQRAGEGLRGGLRAAADRHRPELRGRRHRQARGANGPGVDEVGGMIDETGAKSARRACPPRRRRWRRRDGAAGAADRRRLAADRRARRRSVDHGAARTARGAAGPERMTLDALSVCYGAKAAVKDVSLADPPGRGARADRPVGLRQDDAAAHAEPPDRADGDARAATAPSRSTGATSTRSR